jgi:uncharacterized protein (DUF2062 family)
VLGGNLPATYLGSALVNPLTGPAIYFTELWIGTMLLGVAAPSWVEARAFESEQWLALFRDLLPAFGLGGLVVAAGTALIVYPVLRLLVSVVQSRAIEPTDGPPSQ